MDPRWAAGILVSLLVLLVILWRYTGQRRTVKQTKAQVARLRAERLLRESLSHQAYQQLVDCGYLQIPSRLYPERYYRIPRKSQRVQVFEKSPAADRWEYRKLGELCVVSCEPVPDADLFLTHKWMIEADEPAYLSIANWFG
jgi:hypothetical protein